RSGTSSSPRRTVRCPRASPSPRCASTPPSPRDRLCHRDPPARRDPTPRRDPPVTTSPPTPAATATGYAVVAGEALVDLIEADVDGQAVFRPMVGGAPLNVAAGLARLGASSYLITSISTDALGQRIWDLLGQVGVDRRACRRVDVPTTLAVTSLRDAVPEFTFYGDPPSFAQVDPADLDRDLVERAATLYCGSIALMYPAARQLATAAWATPGPLRVL